MIRFQKLGLLEIFLSGLIIGFIPINFLINTKGMILVDLAAASICLWFGYRDLKDPE